MRVHVTCTLLPAVLAACGAPTPPPKPPEPQPTTAITTAPPPRTGPKIGVSQELGEIDQKLAKQTLDRAEPELFKCHKSGIRRVAYLSGSVKFFLRIGQDGVVRWAYLEESTLGDRATEKCMLDVLRRAPFPKPDGGDAEVRRGWSFTGDDTREPTQWASAKVSPALEKRQAELAKCREGVKGTFKITAYIEPDAQQGKIAAVGVAAPSKEGEANVDCIVSALTGAETPSPGSYAAKVTFSL